MRFEIDWDSDVADVVARGSGVADLPTSLAMIAAVVDGPRFPPRARVMIDDRELDGFATTASDVDALVHAVAERSARLAGCRCAVVVGGALDFGLARMWQLSSGERTGVGVQLFYDVDAAAAWLAAGTPPPPE